MISYHQNQDRLRYDQHRSQQLGPPDGEPTGREGPRGGPRGSLGGPHVEPQPFPGGIKLLLDLQQDHQ